MIEELKLKYMLCLCLFAYLSVSSLSLFLSLSLSLSLSLCFLSPPLSLYPLSPILGPVPFSQDSSTKHLLTPPFLSHYFFLPRLISLSLSPPRRRERGGYENNNVTEYKFGSIRLKTSWIQLISSYINGLTKCQRSWATICAQIENYL